MTLFDTLPDPPAYHTADPLTSRDALDAHERAGARSRNQRTVLGLVNRTPGATACELWTLTATDEERAALKELQEVRRRLTDLCAKGVVAQGTPRTCRVKANKQTTWNPVA